MRGVYPSGPAARAGLYSGDTIVRIQDQPVATPEDAIRAVRELAVNEPAEFTIRRDDEELTITLVPGERRYLLVDSWARYAAAFGSALETVFAGPDLEPRPSALVVPEPLRPVALNEAAARREVLGRYLALSGPVTLADIASRYAFDPAWVHRRLDEWERSHVLVRGAFGAERDVVRWSARRPLERARRVELATSFARKGSGKRI